NEYFPHVKIARHIKSRITTNKNGFIYATSTGGTLTGEGGDIFIIDDPHNPAHLHSTKLQNKVIDWYEQVLYSRLNNPKDSKIVVVMQRLHLNDLTGHLSKNNDWTILSIPIISQENFNYTVNDFTYEYRKNDLLDKNRFSHTAVDKIKNNIGISNWQAQYMQSPIAKVGIIESNMIIKENINNLEFEFVIQSWDTAIKIDANSDFSVCITFGIINNKYYVIDIYRGKLTYPNLKEKAIELLNMYTPHKILIEDKSSGQSLIQDLCNININNIIAIKPKINKSLRLALNLEFFFNKQIIFNKNINPLYIEELLIFPFAKHDDIVDAISQFLEFIKQNNIMAKEQKVESLIR
ncbi:MAG: phage terminase large subunit, partial [Rickettsiales bacterium]